MHKGQRVLILDCGSQYTPLIARRVREARVYCEVLPWDVPPGTLEKETPIGIILSGGPQSVYDDGAPDPPSRLLGLQVPVLGICYGMHWLARALGGKVSASQNREYGRAEFRADQDCPLFRGLPRTQFAWMSHGDRVEVLPGGFKAAGESANAPVAAMYDREMRRYGIQFHPEVTHTFHGREILRRFLYDVCGAVGDWTSEAFLEECTGELRRRVGAKRVLCAVSGGVDSSVMAILLNRAVGKNLDLVFIDHGLLRKGEAQDVSRMFSGKAGLKLHAVDASDRFFEALEGLADPELKRKAVGETFIRVFEAEAKKLGRIPFLAQGTIYPDRIESAAASHASQVIKSHHNVGGLPERMNMEVLEPLRDLFKDEVRALGRNLGLPDSFVRRHPFPGPGLAVRIPGEVTRADAEILREADAVFLEEIESAGLYEEIAQAFAVLLPVRTVGVMGDARTYERAVALRAVTTTDFMTADWYPFQAGFLARVSNRIVNEVTGVNRVVYDITSKPPGTIEWE